MARTFSAPVQGGLTAESTGEALIPLVTLIFPASDLYPADDDAGDAPTPAPTYSVSAAKRAAQTDDGAYFDSTIPASVKLTAPITPARPAPPRLRGSWIGDDVFDLTAADHGKLGKDVIKRPRFQVAGGTSAGRAVFDPQSRFWINPAPDGSVGCLEFRHLSGVTQQHVEFRLDDFGYPGTRALGLSWEAFWPSSYNWGSATDGDGSDGGKFGWGSWAGPEGGDATGTVPPEEQEGFSLRVIWGTDEDQQPGNLGAIGRLYCYAFNRRIARVSGTMQGSKSGRWFTPKNRWVPFDVEMHASTAGKADGIFRLWMDGVLQAEENAAVVSLAGDWGFRGWFASDQQTDGVPPQNQSYYVRKARYWTPARVDRERAAAVASATATDPGMAKLRLAANPTNVVSRGKTFVAYPFEAVFPDDTDEGAPTARLTLDNVNPAELIPFIRTNDEVTVVIEGVRPTAVDVPEATFPHFMAGQITYDNLTIEIELVLPDLTKEAYPASSYSPATVPALGFAFG